MQVEGKGLIAAAIPRRTAETKTAGFHRTKRCATKAIGAPFERRRQSGVEPPHSKKTKGSSLTDVCRFFAGWLRAAAEARSFVAENAPQDDNEKSEAVRGIRFGMERWRQVPK